jgi:hypothetical protein
MPVSSRWDLPRGAEVAPATRSLAALASKLNRHSPDSRRFLEQDFRLIGAESRRRPTRACLVMRKRAVELTYSWNTISYGQR